MVSVSMSLGTSKIRCLAKYVVSGLDGSAARRMYQEPEAPYRMLHAHLSFHIQAAIELAATYAALILADDGVEITVSTCQIFAVFNALIWRAV